MSPSDVSSTTVFLFSFVRVLGWCVLLVSCEIGLQKITFLLLQTVAAAMGKGQEIGMPMIDRETIRKGYKISSVKGCPN